MLERVQARTICMLRMHTVEANLGNTLLGSGPDQTQLDVMLREMNNSCEMVSKLKVGG